MLTGGPLSADGIAEPIGDPQPVQASQPAWAEYVPLFPLVMSWKVLLTGAICEYTSEDSAPTLLPSIWLMQAVRPAQSGATALVPPITEACPSTYTSYPVTGSASPGTSGTPRPTKLPGCTDGGM